MRHEKLNQLCEINIGKTPSRSNSRYWGKGHQWLSIADMKSKYLNETKEEITDLAVNETNMKIVPKNTVLMSFKLSIGKLGITKEEMYTNEAIASFPIIEKDKLIPEFLYYALKTLRLDNLSDRAVMGSTLNKKKLNQIVIPLPSISVQKKIVNLLNQAEDLIDKRKAQIEALDQLTQSVFLEMFGDPILNKKQWSKQKLGKLCTVVRGGSPRPINNYLGGTVPWIKIGDASKGDNIYLKGTKEKIIEEGIKKSRYIKEGSLIFANCGVSLGFARIITFDGCIHDGWLAFQDISEGVNKVFLLKLLNHFTDFFRKTAPDGTQPNLNTTIMKNFEVIIPPLDLQEKFVKIIIDIELKRDLFQKGLNEIEIINQSLMQRAFKGELLTEEKVSNL